MFLAPDNVFHFLHKHMPLEQARRGECQRSVQKIAHAVYNRVYLTHMRSIKLTGDFSCKWSNSVNFSTKSFKITLSAFISKNVKSPAPNRDKSNKLRLVLYKGDSYAQIRMLRANKNYTKCNAVYPTILYRKWNQLMSYCCKRFLNGLRVHL